MSKALPDLSFVASWNCVLGRQAVLREGFNFIYVPYFQFLLITTLLILIILLSY